MKGYCSASAFLQAQPFLEASGRAINANAVVKKFAPPTHEMADKNINLEFHNIMCFGLFERKSKFLLVLIVTWKSVVWEGETSIISMHALIKNKT